MADEIGTKNRSSRRFSYSCTPGSCLAMEEKSRRVSLAPISVPVSSSAVAISAVGLDHTRHTRENGTTEMIHLPFDNYLKPRSSTNRRGNRTGEDGFNCSQQSILSAMDRFVKSINNMNATLLVPSKLRDMDLAAKKLRTIPPALANKTDLYSFYLMLNDVKKELLWGPGTASTTATTLVQNVREIKHVRQPSDDSLGSLGSTASSSDPDTDSDADSIMTDRESIDEHSFHLAAAFRHHLQGLQTILHQLADSSDYLSSRYQEDIDATSL